MSIIEAIHNTHNNNMQLSESIIQTVYDEHTLLVIKHPQCKAAISLQGAHLLYWQPTTESTPAIWLSEKTAFKKGVAIRGGIPICWPWFSNVATPAHGFARIVDWQLTHFSENEHGVKLVLSLKNDQSTQKFWPHAFELDMTFVLGHTCELQLSCSGDFEATSALHTYFGISDISTITLTGLGDSYHEKLSTTNQPKVSGHMRFDQEVDRIYTAPEAETLIKDTDRIIKISHFNNSDVVTWNPWAERASSMSDLGDDSYHHFVCVETCRINQPIKSVSNQKTTYGVKIEIIKS